MNSQRVLLVALIGAFVVFAIGDAKECPLKKALMESIEACADKLSEDSAKLLHTDEFADTEEIRCFHACVMSRSGLMVDGKMDMDKLEEAVKSDPGDAETADKIIAVIKECQAGAETTDNECDVAGNYIKCLKAKKEAEQA